MPIKTETVFNTKIKFQCLISIPFVLFCSIVACVLVKSTAFEKVLIIVTPIIFNYFVAILGLVFNLRYPNLDWISETVAVKQSISVVLTMVVSFAAVCIPGVVIIFFNGLPTNLFFSLVAVLLILLSIILNRHLMTKGKETFESL